MKQIFLILLLGSCFAGISRAQICESLFGETELYRSIRSLAELRLDLDLVQTGNDDSITISVLMHEYAKKEKSILKYISREQLLKIMKFEIANLQKEKQAENQIRTQQAKDVYENAIDGSLGIFHEFKFEDSDSPKLAVMATPTTEIIWRKVFELVSTKLDSSFYITNFDPFTDRKDLSPVSGRYYSEIEAWIKGLNQLSRVGSPELKGIFPSHQNGDVYRLPSLEEWKLFLSELSGQTFKTKDVDARTANTLEEVGLRNPYQIQNRDYFVLMSGVGNGHHAMEHIPTPYIKDQVDVAYTWAQRLGKDLVTLKTSSYGHSINSKLKAVFRLFRERKQP